ncbi:FG-GAP-like repeat-containing protein, partial [Perlabentimonas gracilis]|uniref:FG-GAP-like repeat-containing protein n=1 Tax=Perlabentimonas gracilis TaxID=2715279 RepID=UPI00140D0131
MIDHITKNQRWAFELLIVLMVFFSTLPLTVLSQNIILSEDFSTASGTTPPAGWTVEVAQGNANEVWRFDNPGNKATNFPIVAPFAIFDSDYYGDNGTVEEVYLISPEFDATTEEYVFLEFHEYFQEGYDGLCEIELFNGVGWVNVYVNSTSTSNPEPSSINVTDQIRNVPNARVRFKWTGDYSWYWIIDNVVVKTIEEIPVDLFTEYPIADLYQANQGTVRWFDFDNDGNMDIIISDIATTLVYRNNGDGSFALQEEIELNGALRNSLAIADYNNDGFLDVLLSRSNGPTCIYRNNGEGGFVSGLQITDYTSYQTNAIWGDYDNDGNVDLLLFDNRETKLYRNNGNNTFTEQTNINLLDVTSGVAAWGDYDNDGYLDLIISGSDKDYNRVTKIYRNEGGHSFTEQTEIQITNIIGENVAWGDYDNDGFLDLLITGSHMARVYRNNGAGNFIWQSGLGLAGVSISSAAWADFNNDGHLDIVLAGQSVQMLNIFKVYQNNGNNTFSEITMHEIPGVDYCSIDLADFDNDGKIDLLVSGRDNSNQVVTKVFKNNTKHSNATPNVPLGLNATVKAQSVLLEWDSVTGDETPENSMTYNVRVGTTSGGNDVVSSMSLPAGNRLLSGMGNTQTKSFFELESLKNGVYYWSVQAIDGGYAASPFAPEQSFTFKAEIQASHIFADNIEGNRLTLHWRRGNGKFCIVFAKQGDDGVAVPQDYSSYTANSEFGVGTEIGESGWYCIYKGTECSVDIEGLNALTNYRFHVIEFEDGPIYYTEIVISNPATIKTQVFTELTDIHIQGFLRGSFAWGDFNNNNLLDFIVMGNGSTAMSLYPITHLYKNLGNDEFVIEQTLEGIQQGSVAWSDYNNNGFLDIFISGNSNNDGVTLVYKNNNGTDFAEETQIQLLGVTESSVALHDFDNDGDIDLLLCGATSVGEQSQIYRNNGNGTFSLHPGIDLEGISGGDALWGDLNNDGYVDLFLLGHGATIVYINNGDNTFTRLNNTGIPNVEYGSAAIGDYDNDGFLDIVLTGQTNKRIASVFRNNGDGTFTEQIDIELEGVAWGSIALGDYDNDGLLDIVISGMENGEKQATRLYRNNGDNTFSEQSHQKFLGLTNSTVAFGDYDNDGDLDIFVMGVYNYSLYAKIYRNDINTPNNRPLAPTGLGAEKEIHKTILSWDPVTTDETPQKGMSYNVRVGKTPGGSDVKSAMSSNDGVRKIPALGNCGHSNYFELRNLLPGDYYWSVQAVDNGYRGGYFAPEQSFTIESIQASNLQAYHLRSGSLVIKWDKGNGTRRVVFCKQGSLGTAHPIDFRTYTADPTFGYGDEIGNTGWYCVYNGRADSTTVYGLSAGLTYNFQVVEYVGTTGAEEYYHISGNANPGAFSTGLFSELTDADIVGAAYGSVDWGDFNNDGYIDLVITGSDGFNHNLKAYTNSGDNTFAELSGIDLPGLVRSSVHWADFNNDDNLDFLIVGTYWGEEIARIYINDGNGAFSYNESGINANLTNPKISIGDYDNDGYMDLLVSGSLSGSGSSFTRVYRNNGDNTFYELLDTTVPDLYSGFGAWVDYNNDGLLDIFISGYLSIASLTCVSKIFKNNGDGTFTEDTQVVLPSVHSSSAAWGDYDNDGYIDLLLTGFRPGFGRISKVFRNISGSFFDIEAGLEGVIDGAVAWGDFNNNGLLDIIITGEADFGSVTKIYFNNGDHTFTEATDLNLTGVKNSAIALADFDNDGDLDFIITGETTGSAYITKVYRNNLVMRAGAFEPNQKPSTPKGLVAKFEPIGIRLYWQNVKTDETHHKAMSYNVWIGTHRDWTEGQTICSPHSSLDSGFRRITSMGNAQLDTTFLITGLTSGIYYWQVQAIDQGYLGSEWSELATFEVKNTQAFFSATTVCHGQPTQFTDQSQATDGIVSWKWYFGDGGESTDQHPQHPFATSGTHSVKLVVASATDKDSIEVAVVVKPSPLVDFNAPTVCLGQETTLTNLTDTYELDIASWTWDYGDGKGSVLQEPPPHGYINPGSYQVGLYVAATNGCAGSMVKTVSVGAIPSASLSANAPLSFCQGQSVTLEVPFNENHSYQW